MYLKNRLPILRKRPPSLVLAGAPDESLYSYFDGCDKNILKGSEFPPWIMPQLIFFYYKPELVESVVKMSLEFQCPVATLIFAPPRENWSETRRNNLTKFGHICLAINKELGDYFGVDVLPPIEKRDDFLSKLQYIEFYPLKVS